jgi:hypothetical protein
MPANKVDEPGQEERMNVIYIINNAPRRRRGRAAGVACVVILAIMMPKLVALVGLVAVAVYVLHAPTCGCPRPRSPGGSMRTSYGNGASSRTG